MKHQKVFLCTTIVFGTMLLGACVNSDELMVQTELAIAEGADISESRMPATPTAQELAEVMMTYNSHEDYKGKLVEVGLMKPEYILNDQALAGDGVSEFKADIHFYKASDGYFALYEQDDKILKELPESIGKNVWTAEEAERFMAEKSHSN